MSRHAAVQNHLSRIQGRRFRFKRCFHDREFVSFLGHGRGKKGYVLEDLQDHAFRIEIGTTAFHDNFIIIPRRLWELVGSR